MNNNGFTNVKTAGGLAAFWIAAAEIIVAVLGLSDTAWGWIALGSGIPLFIILVAALNWLTSESR